MRKRERYTADRIIKTFLLTVFSVMCLCALFVCTQYAGEKTRHTIDGSEAQTVSTEEIESFLRDRLGNLCG